ncbi:MULTISPECIES: SH3 domain-containing protein [unclassified Coleofasciculus]|uniref:SH3 domain-containing protein n=1 Tax=unclassified Coleofasciculus TaxID=2692782 RepID=UPI0018825FE0|nr:MULTISPECIES: SH3 domain-containing protein [unclassified Coleofasciculus]MBE9125797.1 SH3 domain-containing protein [Coleofasciculus sp. LEGE 07081]MBE9149018.1 SH3 domain-containing protein [Coleofasciculus sp. LEGE 07092]
MKTMNYWGKSAAVLAFVFSAVGGLNAPVSAVNSNPTDNAIQASEPALFETQGNVQLAQAGLIGQCRAVKKRIFIYTERSTSSRTITTLASNEEVTLAGNGNGGWIAISSPETGYVQTMDLKLCQNANQPDTNTMADICRRVAIPQGLAVRRNPSLSAARVGGVFVGKTVQLATPRRSEKDNQGRTWIQITEPIDGWISSGFPEGNLTAPSACP